VDSEITGRPIFFVPPIEGDFSILQPLAKSIDRPIIGINWTEEIDHYESVAELAKHYVLKLKEVYPDGQYDLVGYSYGGLVAFEMAMQLQELFGGKTVKKLLLLDSSPYYLKALTDELQAKNQVKNEEEGYVDILMDFASNVFPMDIVKQKAIKVGLLELATMEDRTKSIADLITQQSSLIIDAKMLTSSAERYFRKMKMVHFYEPGHRMYKGEVKLVRASEIGYSNASMVDIDADYNLSKCCSNTIESHVLDGNHKTYIANHTEEIAFIIDSHFHYVSFA
jgi:thioesterase domain-containing protein